MNERDLAIREGANDGAMGISTPRMTSDEEAYAKGVSDTLEKVREWCDLKSEEAKGSAMDGSVITRARQLGRSEGYAFTADHTDRLQEEATSE